MRVRAPPQRLPSPRPPVRAQGPLRAQRGVGGKGREPNGGRLRWAEGGGLYGLNTHVKYNGGLKYTAKPNLALLP